MVKEKKLTTASAKSVVQEVESDVTFSYANDEDTIWGALRRGNVAHYIEPKLRE